MGEQHRQLGFAVEWACARQALEEDAAERVHIGPTVDLSALYLLRWDVVDGSDEATLGGQARDGAHVASEPEIADVGLLAVLVACDQDVPRLHVAVHEPRFMRGIERARHLSDQIERPLRLQPAFPSEQVAEIGALHVGHREVERSLLLAGCERRNDMRDVRGSLRARSPAGTVDGSARRARARRKELQGDTPAGVRLLRQVDRAHRSLAEQRLHAKTADNVPL